jgi:hypothetical protein
MKWMRVIGGLPPAPNPSDFDEVCSMPGPFSFFQRLFLVLSNVIIDKPGTVTETEVPEGRGGDQRFLRERRHRPPVYGNKVP